LTLLWTTYFLSNTDIRLYSEVSEAVQVFGRQARGVHFVGEAKVTIVLRERRLWNLHSYIKVF
jgi:hypothetical protein